MVRLTVRYLASGVTMVLLGIFLTAWTPTEMVLYDRLFMRKGFLPFVWWQNPPESFKMVEFKFHIFNVTNSEAFLNGSDSKLNVEEVGPFVFGDNIKHFWTTFNENNTMSFGTRHNLIYDPAKNSENLDAKLIIPNLALVALASMVSEMNMFYKLMFHGIYRAMKPKLFIETTPRNLLWNYSDPLLDKFKNFLPLVMPSKDKFGIINMINPSNVKNVTVLIGPENGHERFFTIDNFDGSKYLPNQGPKCKDTLVNASESQFPQYLKRTAHVKIFKDTYCRYIDLFYERDVSRYGIDAYEFQVSKTLYHRKQPLENDCYKSNPPLPNGAADFSQCASGVPAVLSFPHFLHADFTQDRISGYHQNASRFPNYLIIEPLSGAPLESELSCQLNMHVKNLTGIDSSLKVFQNLFLPVIWVKVRQDLPWYMIFMVFIAAKLAPIMNIILCVILIAVGCSLVYLSGKKSRTKKSETESELVEDADEKKVTDNLISSFI